MVNDAITTKVREAYAILESAHKLNKITQEDYDNALAHKPLFEKAHDIALLEPLNVKVNDLAQALAHYGQSNEAQRKADDYSTQAQNLERRAAEYVESARTKKA